MDLPQQAKKSQIVTAVRENVVRSGNGTRLSGSVVRAAPRQNGPLPDGVFQIINNSGGDRSRFDIMGLDGPIVSATDNLKAFQNSIGFKGVIPVAPTHYGKWGVLLTDIRNGKRGLIRVSGIAVARVTINDPTDLCAGITSGDPSRLNSSPSAVSQILATSTVDGVTWAYVRLGTTVEAEDLNCST